MKSGGNVPWIPNIGTTVPGLTCLRRSNLQLGRNTAVLLSKSVATSLQRPEYKQGYRATERFTRWSTHKTEFCNHLGKHVATGKCCLEADSVERCFADSSKLGTQTGIEFLLTGVGGWLSCTYTWRRGESLSMEGNESHSYTKRRTNSKPRVIKSFSV